MPTALSALVTRAGGDLDGHADAAATTVGRLDETLGLAAGLDHLGGVPFLEGQAAGSKYASSGSQIGPPVSRGRGSNSQSGSLRPTTLPSGQIVASAGHGV